MLEYLQFHVVRNRSTLEQLAPVGCGGSLGIGGVTGKYLVGEMSIDLAGLRLGGEGGGY